MSRRIYFFPNRFTRAPPMFRGREVLGVPRTPGALAQTLADATVSAAGVVVVAGTLTQTLADATVSSAGTISGITAPVVVQTGGGGSGGGGGFTGELGDGAILRQLRRKKAANDVNIKEVLEEVLKKKPRVRYAARRAPRRFGSKRTAPPRNDSRLYGLVTQPTDSGFSWKPILLLAGLFALVYWLSD